jgi:hypothetical protein
MIGWIITKNGKKLKTEKKFILVIEQEVLRDDINALAAHQSKYELILYPEIMRQIIGDICWPDEIKMETTFYEKKERYRKVFERIENIHYNVLMLITKLTKHKMKAILAGNFDEFQDYLWITAIHKAKGKFIAFCNETIITKKTKERITNKFLSYIFRFDGDAILFHNEASKHIFERLISFDKDKMYVVGLPKMDQISQINKAKGEFILIFPFTELKQLCKETIDAICENQELRPKSIIMCRNNEEVINFQSKYIGLGALYIDLKFILEEGPKVAVGFNSTSCLDSMVAGIPVIMPIWAEAKDIELDESELMGEHTKKFHEIVKNKESLIKLLEKYLNDKKEHPLSKEATEYIEKRYSLIDGNNCKRFFDVIDSICK